MLSGTYQIELYCPAMKIIGISRKLKKTAEEPMIFTMKDSLGNVVLTVPDVIIPETMVRKVSVGPLRWRVDACVGQDANKIVTCNLPVEDVIFNMRESIEAGSIVVIAERMIAPTIVRLEDGSIGSGEVVFPDCKVDMLHGGAEALTAPGAVTFI